MQLVTSSEQRATENARNAEVIISYEWVQTSTRKDLRGAAFGMQ